jgi:multiple sugar transport system substrate-binding protein
MNPNRPRVISQGPSVCIFNNAGGSSITDQQIVASWLFVRYLVTSVEFQAEFSMASGYVPVLKSVASNPVYKAFTEKANGGDNIAALSAKACLTQESAYYTSPAFNGSSKARDQVGSLVTKVLSGQTSNVYGFIAEAFEDAIDECEY